MKRSMKISILSAEDTFYEGDCVSLIIPTVDGQFGIMAGHNEVIMAVVPGELSYTTPDGVKHLAAVSSGMMKVEKGEALVLVDTAERPEEIDENRAKRAAEAAREQILQKKTLLEYKTAEAHLARALSRLKVKGHGSMGK